MLKSSFSDMLVLIVDDQRPFQVMLKGILNSLGIHQIHFANQGEQASSRCSQNEYDLLFVDYNLGSGKNGRQLLADLRQKKLLKPSSIFIIVTGENTVTMVMSAVELEPDDYLIKPFSQSLLKSRLQKISLKKQQLSELYQAIYQQDSAAIMAACQHEIVCHGRFEQFCRRVLAETLLEQQLYPQLEALLADSTEQRQPNWALLLEAKFRLQQHDYQRCLEICDKSLTLNRLCAQAYDLKASCQLAMADTEAAMQSVQQALAIAPYHLPRQYLSLKVARAAGLSAEMVLASKQIFELTRRTSQQHVSHLFNYIRTMLDAIADATDASKKNRLQQETLLTLHRSHSDESLIRDVDYERFEKLCMARLEAMDGRVQQAKKTASSLVSEVQAADADLPDMIMLLLSIGEFEDAEHFLQLLHDTEPDDPVLSAMLTQHQHRYAGAQQRLAELNQTGMVLYQEGKYQEAVSIYEQSLSVAPGNTSAMLNLLQSMLQVLESQQKNKSLPLYQRCRQTLKLLEPALLPQRHQERYNSLYQQYQQFRHELKQHS